MVTPLDKMIPKYPLRGMSRIQLNEHITEMQGWGKDGEGARGEEASEKKHILWRHTDSNSTVFLRTSHPGLALPCWEFSRGVSVQISTEPHASKAFIFALLSLTFVPCTSAYLSRS